LAVEDTSCAISKEFRSDMNVERIAQEAAEGSHQQVSIADLIRQISNELVAARAARLAAGDPAVFEVEGLDIEVSFTVGRSRSGSGGVDVRVVQLGGQGSHDQQAVQKLTLHLKATTLPSGQPEFTDFDASTPLRPRIPEPFSDRDAALPGEAPA
jgi:hypothetical protein